MKVYFKNMEDFSREQLNEVYDEIRIQASVDRVAKNIQAQWWGDHGEYLVDYQVDESGTISMEISLMK